MGTNPAWLASLSEEEVKRHEDRKDGHPQDKEKVFRRNQTCQCLNKVLGSRIVREKHSDV